ncbi:serine--tRNA ligase [Psittacicella melopsittaci]|uniref:Serine--tRNA ligase n=1 Tax=Psittacicella melopsittaci TaxID=2028576 RepID=A0A3A1XZU1_9GAMM|nr:serine--tRNA ligase [Psittacicella melopsittaci]RIY31523.1 serine--tRNA ligase [Psittacicella melopsittaci]
MLDPVLLRTQTEEVARLLKLKRNVDLDVELVKSLESQRAQLQTSTESTQAKRNELAGLVGRARAKGENADELIAQANALGQNLDQEKAQLAQVQQQLFDIASRLPNLPADEVPLGKDENDNVEIKRWGTPRTFDFEVKDHVDLGELTDGIDFKSAARLTGSRFVVFKSDIARLHRALIQFMLEEHYKAGYQEVYVPYMVNQETLFGTGQLPKFAEDLFQIKPIDDQGDKTYYLIPTAEVPVTNLVADQILNDKELPLRFCSHTPCFRSEAGSYGRDTRGCIRLHQFEKVELVHISKPEDSMEQLEKLTAQAESILEKLGLPYRRIVLCTGDMGFSAQKTYDLEVWLPAQNTYREISSCSNMGDFQARRMKARFRREGSKKPELVHTLNGSGLALSRTLVAILENYQQADGSIVIPEALRKYMYGQEVIQVAK